MLKPRLFLAFLVASITGCGPTPENTDDVLDPEVLTQDLTALPGGKRNWSAVLGWFNTTAGTTARLQYLTFSSTGTVTIGRFHWDSNLERGMTPYLSHVSTDYNFGPKTCRTYTPTGWMAPSGMYTTHSGTFSISGSTVVINIGGLRETWTVQKVDDHLSRMFFVSSNYGITHGRMVGSNASRSVFKTISQIPRINYPGYTVGEAYGTSAVLIARPDNTWKTYDLNLTNYRVQNANTLHWLNTAAAPAVPSSCSPGREASKGMVLNLASANVSRAMLFDHWFWCLPPVSALPCYTGQMHPYAIEQVIDDLGTLRGFIGVHQQDMAGSVRYSYSLVDWIRP